MLLKCFNAFVFSRIVHAFMIAVLELPAANDNHSEASRYSRRSFNKGSRKLFDQLYL